MQARLRSMVLALGAALLLAACGGGSQKSADVNSTALLDSAFSHPIPTSQTGVEFNMDVQGVPSLGDPITLKLDGPYVSGKGMKIPSVDWDLDVSVAGLSVGGKAISTGDDAFVQFLGRTYQVGPAAVTAQNRKIVAATQAAGGHPQPLANLGIHPRTWFRGGTYEGDEDVDGVRARHISAQIDGPAVVGDLHGLADNLNLTGGRVAPVELSPAGRREVDQGIKSSTIEVWIGADDEIVRRLRLRADFTIPAGRRDTVGGMTGGSFSLDITQSDVGNHQQIAAPPPPYEPIAKLLDQLPPIPGLGAR